MRKVMSRLRKGTSMLSTNRRRKKSQQLKKHEPKVVQEHGLELKPFDLNTYINRKLDNEQLQKAINRKNGMGMLGFKEDPLSDSSKAGASAAEIEFRAFLQSIKDQITYQIDSDSAELRTRHALLISSYREKTKEERKEDYLLQKSKRINRRTRRILGRNNNQFTTQEKIDLIETSIGDELSEQQDLIHQKYQHKLPKERFLDYLAIYATLMICISLAEFPLNFVALQYLGDISNAFVLILSLFFALIIGVSAHAAGQAIYKRKRWEAVTAGLIGLAVCGVVSILRSKLDGSLLMSFMNVLIFGFGTFLAYEHSKNLSYWSSVKKVKRLRRRKARLQTRLRRSMNVLEAEAEKAVREQMDDLKRFIDASAAALAMIDGYKEQIIKRLDAIYAEGIAMYRHANSKSSLKTKGQVASTKNTNHV